MDKKDKKDKKKIVHFKVVVLLIFLVNLVSGCTSENGEAKTSVENTKEVEATEITNAIENEVTTIDADATEKLDPTRDGLIVFENEANRDYNFEVFIMNGDGTAVTQLTNNPGYDGGPCLSPDLNKIAFSSNQGGKVDIYLFDLEAYLNGEMTPTLLQLTTEGNNYAPTWSPDGQIIAFQTDRDGAYNIYKMNADGTNQLRYIDLSEASYLSWSPDGTSVAFSAKEEGNNDIYTMKCDGSELKKITSSPGDEQFAAWSPDGEKIAYSNIGSNGSFDLYVMDKTGENQVALITDTGLDEFPKWSPDGSHILFRSSITGSDQLTIMKADGTEINPLTKLKGQSMPYDWKK